MSKTRTIRFAAVAVLTLLATAFSTLPATAVEDTDAGAGFLVALELTSTLPRVEGVVTVTDLNGTGVGSAIVEVTSTYDLAPLAPAARAVAVTNATGVAGFFFGYASTGSLPGDHTLTVVVTKGNVTETATFGYTVPQA